MLCFFLFTFCLRSDFLPFLFLSVASATALVNLDSKAELCHSLGQTRSAATTRAYITLQALSLLLSLSRGLEFAIEDGSVEAIPSNGLSLELVETSSHRPDALRLSCCHVLTCCEATTSAIDSTVTTLAFPHKATKGAF